MRELQRPRLWLGLWIAMLVAVVVVSLVQPPDLQVRLQHLDQAGHGRLGQGQQVGRPGERAGLDDPGKCLHGEQSVHGNPHAVLENTDAQAFHDGKVKPLDPAL